MTNGGSVGGLLWGLHRRVVDGPAEGVHYECRRCGQSLQDPRQDCPGCGAADVARYEL